MEAQDQKGREVKAQNLQSAINTLNTKEVIDPNQIIDINLLRNINKSIIFILSCGAKKFVIVNRKIF